LIEFVNAKKNGARIIGSIQIGEVI